MIRGLRMEIKREIKDLKQEADIMTTKQFRKRIRELLYKEGIIKEQVNFLEVDGALKDYFDDRISEIESEIEKIKPDVLDEIFLNKRETKLNNKLKEEKSINEHIRNIYKRDLKRNIGVIK